MYLESKVLDLEKKVNNSQKKSIISPKNNIESPALSVSYKSDMSKKGNLSVKYAELSDSEIYVIKNRNNNVISKGNDKSIDNTQGEIYDTINKKSVSDKAIKKSASDKSNKKFEQDASEINDKFDKLLAGTNKIFETDNKTLTNETDKTDCPNIFENENPDETEIKSVTVTVVANAFGDLE